MKPKFIKLNLANNTAQSMQLAVSAVELMFKCRRELFDDFLGLNELNRLGKGLALIARFSPYFWVITEAKTGEFAGFAYLYDIIGTPQNLFSAYVSTCFRRKFWGGFVAQSSKKFHRYVFGKLALHKLFAEIYADNLLGARCAEKSGFQPLSYNYEQTVRGGKPCDTLVFVKFSGKNRSQSPLSAPAGRKKPTQTR